MQGRPLLVVEFNNAHIPQSLKILMSEVLLFCGVCRKPTAHCLLTVVASCILHPPRPFPSGSPAVFLSKPGLEAWMMETQMWPFRISQAAVGQGVGFPGQPGSMVTLPLRDRVDLPS